MRKPIRKLISRMKWSVRKDSQQHIDSLRGNRIESTTIIGPISIQGFDQCADLMLGDPRIQLRLQELRPVVEDWLGEPGGNYDRSGTGG
ncbi:MAG: hypothetical protein LQ337_001930 [Flavoplaca oasis]|nr:MAG: hypothetical protein LQ337_001930 [Flavoplaca oasis]